MNDKVSRIALVLIGLAVSAFVVKALVNDDVDAQPTDPLAVGMGDGGTGTAGSRAGSGGQDGAFDPQAGATPLNDSAAFDPHAGTGTDAPADAAGADGEQRDPAAIEAVERRDVGPPLEDGTPVELALNYVVGTRSRYRITNIIAQRNRATNAAIGQRWVFDVSTLVAAAGEDGTARIQLTVDAIHIQALFPDGLGIDYDSRTPDDAVLADRDKAVAVKPLLAVIGIPVEFQLAANGGCIDIEGLEAWHEAWAEVVEGLTPGSSRKTVSPYTAETVLFEWSEYLFPPLLGGTLKAGEERDVQILRDTLQSAYVEARGPMTVTHDDGDVFRLRLITTPNAMTRQRPPRSPQEGAVARVHVQSDEDAYDAAWRFQRSPGRLIDAEIDTEYQLWVSWERGQDSNGQKAYERVFLDIERATRVELLSED